MNSIRQALRFKLNQMREQEKKNAIEQRKSAKSKRHDKSKSVSYSAKDNPLVTEPNLNLRENMKNQIVFGFTKKQGIEKDLNDIRVDDLRKQVDNFGKKEPANVFAALIKQPDLNNFNSNLLNLDLEDSEGDHTMLTDVGLLAQTDDLVTKKIDFGKTQSTLNNYSHKHQRTSQSADANFEKSGLF